MKIALLLVVAAAALSIGAVPANAEQPHVLTGAYKKDDLKKLCLDNNGEYYEVQGGFGCKKPCTGGTCSVDCSSEDAGGCTGWTPARVVNPTIRKILTYRATPPGGLLETPSGGSPQGPSGMGTPKPPPPSGGTLR